MVGIKLEGDEIKFLRDFVKKGTQKCKRNNQSTYSATGKPAKRGY
jgi:hypothetical protein